MTASPARYPGPADLIRELVSRPWRWALPAVVVAALAAGLAYRKTDAWEATQTLVIRNEAATNAEAPGKFRQLDDMKAVLETVLELSRSHAVLSTALAKVGPAAGETMGPGWPTPKDVSLLAEKVKLAAPKGAEFGKTEVFYLKVEDKSRDRAVALATAICEQLQARYSQLRDTRARSMLSEITEAERLADADLAKALARLSKLEASVGSDLSELRALEQNSGESDLRLNMLALENELRAAELDSRKQAEVLKILRASSSNHEVLLAAPAGVLEAQPALKRLKEGLVDAKIKTANLLGTMSHAHPLVVASVESEREIRQHLNDELASAIRGVEVDWRLAESRVAKLNEQLVEVRERLVRVAGQRAEYSNLVADVAHRTKLAEETRRKLGDARATQAGAEAASLITAVDKPDLGTDPVGPSRMLILLAGVVGGLAVGVGLVMLTLQPVSPAPAPVAVAAPARAERGRSLSLSQALSKVA